MFQCRAWPTFATLGLVAFSLTGCGGSSAIVATAPTTLQAAATTRNLTIGAAVASWYFGESNYTATLAKEFGELTAENELKFGLIHPNANTDPNPYDFTGADTLVNFAQSKGMKVRGHTLVWHNQVPAWVTSGGFTPTQLSTILKDHIDTVVGRYAGKIFAWDVVNEAFNDDGTMRSTIWNDAPGIGFAGQGTKTIEQALIWTHAADPTTKLFYNDYSAETVNAKSNAIYAMATDFKSRGIPLDGIGFQFHIDLGFDSPATLASVSSNFARFAALGLDIHITELDIRIPDSSPASLTAQAKLYGELVQLCRAQPAVKVIQTWGFTDKYSWIPSFFSGYGWALPFDDTYQKKPAYTSIFDALMAL